MKIAFPFSSTLPSAGSLPRMKFRRFSASAFSSGGEYLKSGIPGNTQMNERHRHGLPSSQTPAKTKEHDSTASRETHRITQKRKFVNIEETLPVKRHTVQYQSSSKHFISSQSSHKKHTKPSKRDSSSRHGYRKWTYSDHDCSGFRDTAVLLGAP